MRDIDHRPRRGRRQEVHPPFAHEFGVAREDDILPFRGDDALSRDHRLHIAFPAAFAGQRKNGTGDGMRRTVLGYRGETEYLLPPLRRRDLGDGEVAFGQRARLVKDEDIRLVHLLEEVGALDQHSARGRRAYAREEPERHGYHQRAGTGHDEEVERAVHPFRPFSRHRAGNYREQQRRYDDGRGVVAGEARDEILGARLLSRGVLDKVEDLRDRGVVKLLLHSDFYAR